jgi:hypothetical protein
VLDAGSPFSWPAPDSASGCFKITAYTITDPGAETWPASMMPLLVVSLAETIDREAY